MLFVAPRNTSGKSLRKLDVDWKLDLFQTTATGYGDLCMQLPTYFDLVTFATNSPCDLYRLDQPQL
jgi:hypothetical protein